VTAAERTCGDSSGHLSGIALETEPCALGSEEPVGSVRLNAMNGTVVARAATLIAVDVADNKLEKAKLFWATHTINSTTTDPAAEVQRITERGAVGAFDPVGIPAVTQEVVGIARPGEGLCWAALLDPTATVPMQRIGLIGKQMCIPGRRHGLYNAQARHPASRKPVPAGPLPTRRAHLEGNRCG